MADYINKIRTTEGDKPVNYEALANKPNSLPNPNKIKFTGSVVAEYDGSSEVTVDIPNGGSEEQVAQIQTNTNDISELNGDLSKLITKSDASPNLWNPNTVVRGSIDTGTGVVTESESGVYIISDYIPLGNATKIYNYVEKNNGEGLIPNTVYTVRAFFYNSDKINSNSYKDGAEADIPSGMAYVRLRIAYNFWVNGYRYMMSTSPQTEYAEYSEGEKQIKTVLEINGIKPNHKGELEIGVLSNQLYKHGNLLKIDEVEQGYIQANGTVKVNSDFTCSGFCELYSDKVYLNKAPNMYYAFYDENKKLISNWTENPSEDVTTYVRCVNVPYGAKFFRCSWNKDVRTDTSDVFFVSCDGEYAFENDLFSVKNTFSYEKSPINPCDYSELTVQVFNKCVCIGDSITAGAFNTSGSSDITGELPNIGNRSEKYSYPVQFKKITGIDTVNMGGGGLSTALWIDKFGEEDFSIFDMAIIHLGINDPSRGVSDADTKSNLSNIISMLKNASNGIKIFLCTIIPSYAYTKNQSILAKSNLIKELYNETYANDSDVILIDLQKYGHTLPYTSYVAGHLSALGYYQMAKDLAHYISWYIDNNKRDFRFIQFIGSNDTYTGD